MKPLIIGLLLAVSVTGLAQEGEKNFIDQNYIEVTGKAELEIVPDMIYLRIILSDKENKDKLILTEIEKLMIEKLSGIGVDVDKDLSVMNYASNMKSYWLKTGVALTKHYRLIVHDSGTLQKVFFEFQRLGISSVTIEKLEHSKMEQYRREVKVNAIKAAREKAESLALAINQEIGKALYIREVDDFSPRLTSNTFNMVAHGITTKQKDGFLNSQDDMMPVDIEFERIRIEGAVLVRFGL